MYDKIYKVINLQSDINLEAKFTDINAKNSWGMVINDNKLWVANNSSNTISIYNLKGENIQPGINIPSLSPTGIVSNYGTGFVITENSISGPSKIIVVTENGTIDGYNRNVDSLKTINLYSDSSKIFKGACIDKNNDYLYITNFKSGNIEKYDKNVTLVATFTDSALSNIGYAPFGIHIIECYIYVTFAEQDTSKEDDVPGIGNGYIDVFDLTGNLIKRFANRNNLNSPWGLTKYDNFLLVGNSGDGKILKYDLNNGKFKGFLNLEETNCCIVVDGLWTLLNNKGNIYFTAGIDEDNHGLIGVIFADYPIYFPC